MYRFFYTAEFFSEIYIRQLVHCYTNHVIIKFLLTFAAISTHGFPLKDTFEYPLTLLYHTPTQRTWKVHLFLSVSVPTVLPSYSCLLASIRNYIGSTNNSALPLSSERKRSLPMLPRIINPLLPANS